MAIPKAVCINCSEEYFGWSLYERIDPCLVCNGLVVLVEEPEKPEREQVGCPKHP